MPPRPRRIGKAKAKVPEGRGRIALIVGVVVLFVLATSLRGIASFYTDYLWFESLDLSSVWRGVLGAQFTLVAIFTVLFFVVMWLNLLVADRMAPPFRAVPSGEDDLVERYHELIGNRGGLIRAGVAVLLALIEGASVSSQWQD